MKHESGAQPLLTPVAPKGAAHTRTRGYRLRLRRLRIGPAPPSSISCTRVR